MRLKELCASVPGLTKEFVHYLEARHYIAPQKVNTKGGQGKIQWRDYRHEEIELVKGMWRLRQQHIPPKDAYELLNSNPSTTDDSRPVGDLTAFMLLRTSISDSVDVLHTLWAFEEFREAAIVFGDWDIIAKVVIKDLASLQRLVIDRIKKLKGIGKSKTETLIAIDPNNTCLYWEDVSRYRNFEEDQDKLLAYILIETKGSSDEIVRRRLRSLPEVIEAASVYGHFDAIAKIAVDDFIHLKKFVNKDLGKEIRDIDRTVTFPVHGREGYYWNKAAKGAESRNKAQL